MPSCGFGGAQLELERRPPTVNRGKGRGFTKPPVRKRRRRR